MENGQSRKLVTTISREANISKSQTQLATADGGGGGGGAYTLPKNMSLSRGFSKVKANEEILTEARHRIESNLVSVKETNSVSQSSSVNILNDLAYFSFALPNLSRFEDDYKFKEYLHNDLIELPTLYSLTESGHLNWWTQGAWEDVNRPLYPMVTSGDGNCLLHAASLSMWGLHDRHLALRKSLHSMLESIPESAKSPLWRRWRWEQACQNRRYGLILSEEEWSREWRSLLKLSSFQPRTNAFEASSRSSDSLKDTTTTVYFESLEEFHVFLLAHILQRPIIIVSDTMLHDADGEPLSPIPFGGVYLPLECDVSACHRFPLVLAYDSAHFSALVLMDNDSDYVDVDSNTNIFEINKKLQSKWPFAIIPITYSSGEVLPVHFGYDPGEDYDWSRFPDTRPPELTPIPNNGNSTRNRHREHSSIVSNGDTIELSRDERLFLIQKYLDIVKLELFDPGPASVKRMANLATNSSGMRVNIMNVTVPPPVYQYPVPKSDTKNSKSIRQKFLNIFKKNDKHNMSDIDYTDDVKSTSIKTTKSSNILKGVKNKESSIPQAISYSKIDPSSSLPPPTQSSSTKPIFHKLVTYKSWPSMFDSMNQHICMLGVKLNLAKPPKYHQMIANYIDSTRLKFDMVQQQQNQPKNNNAQKFVSTSGVQPEHYCVVNQAYCQPNDLCNQCRLSINNSDSSLRSINLTKNSPARNTTQFSYNTANSNRTSSSSSTTNQVLNSNKGRVVPTSTVNTSSGYYPSNTTGHRTKTNTDSYPNTDINTDNNRNFISYH